MVSFFSKIDSQVVQLLQSCILASRIKCVFIGVNHATKQSKLRKIGKLSDFWTCTISLHFFGNAFSLNKPEVIHFKLTDYNLSNIM